MNEAVSPSTINYSYRDDMDAALHDLAGAAGIAALILETFRECPDRCDSNSAGPAMDWLQLRLTMAAENALAIHDRRKTRFNTMNETDAIKAALGRAAREAVA